MNVRSRGGSSSKPDFEVLHPPSPPPPPWLCSCLPHRHPSHPPPVFPHFLTASSSLGLGDLQEQAGVASRRGQRRRRRLVEVGRGGRRGRTPRGRVKSESRSILASRAGWTRPDIAFRSSPSRRYQATLPTSRSYTLYPCGWLSLLPSFRPVAASWPANPLGEPSRFASAETN